MNAATIRTIAVAAAALTPVFSSLRPAPQVAPAPRAAAATDDDDDDARVRTHALASSRVPDRTEAIAAFAAHPTGKAAIADLAKQARVDPAEVSAGHRRVDGEALSAAQLTGTNWNRGFLADGFSPDVYDKHGQVALRLRTNSVIVNPAYSLRDMASSGVLRLKGTPYEQLFRVTINAPSPRTGEADAFLISIGMLSGWKGKELPPVALFMDGNPLEYTVTPHGLQLVKRLREGSHRLTVHVAPEFAGDVFEFRYVFVNRL